MIRKEMKKKVFQLIIGIVLLISVVFLVKMKSVYAKTTKETIVFDEKTKEKEVEIGKSEEFLADFVSPFFGNKPIKKCGYIYNLDDSADYIYMEFENGGYAIYAKQTMEILEYSLSGKLPYNDSNEARYYAGPAKYFYKNDNSQFRDAITGDKINMLESEIVSFSQHTRSRIVNRDVTKYRITNDVLKNYNIKTKNLYSKPSIDSNDLIVASTNSACLIPNWRYFDVNPLFGNNFDGGTYGNGNSGTCGPVAAQLLLGYHNYYNNRRIIEDRFLNGYDDVTNTVINPQMNPNHCTDPMLMSRWTIGTRSEDTGNNSFYSEIITRIMKPNTSGSTNKEVKVGIEDYLSERLSSSEYIVKYEEKGWWFGYSSIESSIIKSEINKGRPIIVSMDSDLGGYDHFVVAYGYQDYTYPDGSGTYEGYIVHFGWPDNNCVWINSAWCDGYVSLKINHMHNYDIIGNIGTTNRVEYRCSSCGHRTDAAINMSARERYTERVTKLSAGEYKDYYVTFATSGNKLIQTFGAKDARIYIYDNEYNLLAQNDDDGYSLNAFFSYNAEANTPYILRVKFYNSSTSGYVKLGVTPAAKTYLNYEKILNSKACSAEFYFDTSYNTTNVITYTPTESGKYKFETNYVGNNRIDTYLYLIDPYSTDECLYNDDGAGDLQALITDTLVANRTYFIVVSTYNIATRKGLISLSVSKI